MYQKKKTELSPGPSIRRVAGLVKQPIALKLIKTPPQNRLLNLLVF